MKHARTLLLAVIAVIGLAVIATVAAQDTPTTNVEVRIWQSTRDTERIFVSARHEDGRWDTLGTIPLAMDQENSRGTYRYSDITLSVPLAEPRAVLTPSCSWHITQPSESGWGPLITFWGKIYNDLGYRVENVDIDYAIVFEESFELLGTFVDWEGSGLSDIAGIGVTGTFHDQRVRASYPTNLYIVAVSWLASANGAFLYSDNLIECTLRSEMWEGY